MSDQLSVYQNLRERDLRREGRFIAEGRFLVERLLSSDWEVESILSSERMAEEMNQLAAGRCPVYVQSDAEIEEIAGFRFHRGVMAAGIRRPFRRTSELLSEMSRCRRLVICPDLTDAENLGSIIRSAAAMGVDGLLLGPASCDPLGRRSLKVSMGTALVMPLVEMEDEAADAEMLKEAGFHLYGTVLDNEAADLRETVRLEKSALLLGNEADGLTPQWRRLSDTLVTLPMGHGTDSLNVSVAGGIFMYELFAKGGF